MLEELYPSDPSRSLTIKSAPGKTKRPENYDVSKDTIKLAKVSGTLDPDEIIITEDGWLTYGTTYAQGLAANGAIDLSEAEQGKDYYEARLTDKNGNNKQLAAWSGSDRAVLDKRSETKGVVMKDGGNGEGDTFYGGTGRDTITLGSEDIARGGAGRDVIIIWAGAKGAEVALQNGDGHDEVQGFGFGFDEAASIVNLEDSSGRFEKLFEKKKFKSLRGFLREYGPLKRKIQARSYVKQLTYILQQARLCVGGDTGPVHLASGLGTPTFMLMGTTDANRNGPYGQLDNALEVERSCLYCWQRSCPKQRDCLADIAVERLQRKIEAEII
ncbi:MAG: hypothetical protein J6N51_12840 [Selenomonas sp.]|nr:hypothetical protein [Selenomonas sp.]